METKVPPMSVEDAASETQRFMTQVYAWMSFALVVTAGVAMFVASSQTILNIIFAESWTFTALLILELVLVMALSWLVNRISATAAIAIFIGYAALNGLTFSVIFLVFTEGSIASTFFITAGTFCAMSIYGYTTKADLTRMGSLLYMALFGLIIASVVNYFMDSTALYWITTYAGVIIFVGLTAYDTQKIKNMNVIGNEGTDADRKEAIMGALTLYLDFINLFLYLLRLFGKRK